MRLSHNVLVISHNVLVIYTIYHNKDYIIVAVLSNELTSGKSQNEPYCSIIWLTSCANIAEIGR